MTTFRITKYNPKKRNEQGHYLDDSEWTAISDIGKGKFNLTYEQYEKVESAYVAAVKAIMMDNNLDFLMVKSLELHREKQDFEKYKETGRLKNINIDYDNEIGNLTNGQLLTGDQIDKTIRLILRETIWMLLINENFEVEFGYDYYMYVKCGDLNPSTLQEIERTGLFVEPEKGRRTIIVMDDQG